MALGTTTTLLSFGLWFLTPLLFVAKKKLARHTRTLYCQSPTPWKAFDDRLGNTISPCERCTSGTKVNAKGAEESKGGNGDDIDTEDNNLDDYEDEESVIVNDDNEDGVNQVVLWSSTVYHS